MDALQLPSVVFVCCRDPDQARTNGGKVSERIVIFFECDEVAVAQLAVAADVIKETEIILRTEVRKKRRRQLDVLRKRQGQEIVPIATIDSMRVVS